MLFAITHGFSFNQWLLAFGKAFKYFSVPNKYFSTKKYPHLWALVLHGQAAGCILIMVTGPSLSAKIASSDVLIIYDCTFWQVQSCTRTRFLFHNQYSHLYSYHCHITSASQKMFIVHYHYHYPVTTENIWQSHVSKYLCTYLMLRNRYYMYLQ